MIGLKGLQQGAAGLVAASGASRHLTEKLKGAFRRARVAAAQSKIGVDDPDERQVREIMALCDKLSADNDIEGAIGDSDRKSTRLNSSH